ncbi:hypothetical protein FB645_004034 [Coemansia sp. IMI 203386]|nr:hypothetical protein FB645_004034 [Coemansia sp. IMI 203386]
MVDKGSEKSTKQASSDLHVLEKFIVKSTCAEAPVRDGWQAGVIGGNDGRRAIHVVVFPTADFEQAMQLVCAQDAAQGRAAICVAATGGGALRHKAEMQDRMNVHIHMVNELNAVSLGWQQSVAQADAAQARSLVCNVGTGVSMISIGKDGAFERVSGSGLGGATFWGLAKRLTAYTDFDTAVLAAHASGDARRVDTLVGDIYGVETSKEIGMPADLVAGFLGKLGSQDASDADLVAALLRMIASNLGQLAVFQARAMGVDTVWFTGGFFQQRPHGLGNADDGGAGVVRQAMVEAVGFWSGGTIEARFPPDASLLGALGAVAASGISA